MGKKNKQAIEKAQECIDKYEIEAIQEQEKVGRKQCSTTSCKQCKRQRGKESINRGILNRCGYMLVYNRTLI